MQARVALHEEGHRRGQIADRQGTVEVDMGYRDAGVTLEGVSFTDVASSPAERESIERINKDLALRLYKEALGQGSYATVDELIDEDVVDHGSPPELQGVNGQKAILTTFRNAFPDLKADIDFMLADRDYIVTRFALTGTHVGEFQSMPASGKRFRIPVTTILRFRDGKLVEMWPQLDMMGLLAQIGAGPGE